MVSVIFFRVGHFYPVELLDPSDCGKSLDEQAADSAKINLGTIRVETIDGRVLWAHRPSVVTESDPTEVGTTEAPTHEQ